MNIDMNLLLVGKTGSGKSSTGNSILNKSVFKAGNSTSSITQECQESDAEILGRKVKVVDAPGLADTSKTTEQDLQLFERSMKKALDLSKAGYDAILMVIRFGRLSKEDKKTFDQINATFGKEHTSQYGILVVTCGEMYDLEEENEGKPFDDWCRDQKGLFQEIMQQFKNRAILFRNKSKDQSEKNKQVNDLFKMIDEMRFGPKRYTKELFDKVHGEKEGAVCDSKGPTLSEGSKGLEKAKQISQIARLISVMVDPNGESRYSQLVQHGSDTVDLVGQVCDTFQLGSELYKNVYK